MDSGPVWHTRSARETIEALGPNTEQGLADREARYRLAELGPSRLAHRSRRSLASMSLGQFTDLMILALLAAALISGLIGDPRDSVAILLIVLLNALIGAIQAYRADGAIATLRARKAHRFPRGAPRPIRPVGLV